MQKNRSQCDLSDNIPDDIVLYDFMVYGSSLLNNRWRQTTTSQHKFISFIFVYLKKDQHPSSPLNKTKRLNRHLKRAKKMIHLRVLSCCVTLFSKAKRERIYGTRRENLYFELGSGRVHLGTLSKKIK